MRHLQITERVSGRRLIMKNKRKPPIYMKVILGFFVILAGTLLLVWLIVNAYCISFVKEQRVAYNIKMLQEAEYEFKELYVQMNQLLTTISGEYVENQEEPQAFLRIKGELEFENKIKDAIYRNGFYNICEGVIVYEDKDNYRYVGSGAIQEGYDFAGNSYFSQMAEKNFTCRVFGPMEETYKAEHVEKQQVICFTKRKQGVAKDGSLPPFVMVAVKYSAIQEMLDRMLSDNAGFFLMNEEGEILQSSGEKNKYKDMETFGDIKREILENMEHTGTLSRSGTLLTNMRLNNYEWILTVADKEDTLFQDINQLAMYVEIFIAACGAAGIGAAVFLSRKMLFPVELLRRMASEMAKGEHIDEGEGDEVGEIRGILNGMKKEIEDLSTRQYISEVREREAQIRVLQSQINPHFLHNTLDNIYCIAQIEEIEPIEILTRNLSEMMRYSVNNKNMYVPLSQELKHMKAYVDIMNVRYEDCIELKTEIEREAENAQVVKLLLQPLVENACIHGILKKKEQRGILCIRAFRKKEVLEIHVEDDGVGITEKIREEMNRVFRKEVKSIRTPKNKGFGIALVNVNDRIRLLDGDEYGIRTEKRPGGGTVVIVTQRYRIWEDKI